MVIALLVCLAGTVATALIAHGEQGKGPLAATVVTDANANGNAEHHVRGEGGERAESEIGELHGALANITLALVIAPSRGSHWLASCIGKILSPQ